MLPDFELVARRARRARRRSRLATVASMFAVLMLLAPAGVLTARERALDHTVRSPASTSARNPSRSDRPIAPPAALDQRPGDPSTVAAVDGVDLSHVYALVDVCVPDSCNLQLVPIRAANSPASDRTGSGCCATRRPKRWTTFGWTH